jgi:outer membrane receptor protein involved in Fe transport
MKFLRFAAVAAVLLLAGLSAFAQGTVTGSLTGTVTSDGAPLPGSTVTVASPNLQGSRTTVSDANGNYNFVGLPPGDYTVSSELAGLQTVTRTTHVSLSGTTRVDAELNVASVTESITVTAAAPAVLETTEVQANYQKKLVDDLPLNKNVNAIALLAPGVTANGPGGAIQISGAMSSDNLIMVNGSTVQDNLRGTTRPLYIEDAIQETTVMTAGISAEYGRFTGGVINAITRSGGNEFSGSIRDSLTNPRWTAQSAANEAVPNSKLGNTYEGTFGGRIIRDRLWFFTAGRYAKTTDPARYATLTSSNTAVFSQSKTTRYEGKLTGQITPRHSVVVDYLNNPFKATNDIQFGAWELAAVDPSIRQKEDFKAAHYNGIFTNNLLGEVNWSKRTFKFVGYGGDNPDIIGGTPIFTYYGTNNPFNAVAHAPWFCGICDTESRDTSLGTAKLTYFVGTKGLGTHNLAGGLEQYKELRVANNVQSPTNITVWIYQETPIVNPDGTVNFTWSPGDTVEAYPVEHPSLGSDLKTNSLFVNDKWDLNRFFSFNIGGRYDKTTAVDQAGNPTSDDKGFSPRLGVTYDPAGAGRVRLGATYGKYVGRLAETVQGQSANAGEPSWYAWYYDGPAVTGTSDQIVRAAIAWWQAKGGLNLNTNVPDNSNIGGVTTQLAGKLNSPGMNEWTAGAGYQFSQNGYIRADYIDRQWNNFYVSTTDLQTGQIVTPGGTSADLTRVGNTNQFDRNYKGVQMQANDRFFNRLNIGGSYTWSKLRGNVEGETVGSGPVSEGGWIFQYPEFQGFTQNKPVGYLSGDQRHKLRAWAGMDFPLGPAGTLNVSALERFDSGLPYSASAFITAAADPAAGNLTGKYVSPPALVTYYFSDRGGFRWDNVTRTDLALNYRIRVASRAELFVEAEMYNMFNQQAQINGNTTVITSRSSTRVCHDSAGAAARCAAFNPFTTTPVRGVNYEYGPSFGKSTGAVSDYQLPRTYQGSVGVRF